MQKLPATTGWRWIKQGFAIFAKKPAELTTLFILYFFMMVIIGIVPIVGQLAQLILIPVFAMTFMQASLNVENELRVFPSLLLTAFRSPQRKTLLMLGMLYLLAALLAFGAAALVDDGTLWQLLTSDGDPDPAKIQQSHILLTVLFGALVYIPAAMAFWFAAPLIAWQQMPLPKALFYSFFAVLRAGRAFLLYALGWIALGVILPFLVSRVLAQLTGSLFLPIIILMPLSISLSVAMYCSFYATYIEIFGKPAPAVDVEA
ncbi:hypothetical protein D9O50_11390 [Oxalobacteraceae bacterium CAVE-383]|nr:hypothetical protein D9O50_11390 [Oxalobacteraceae bacterium CAVE-383]